MSPGLHATLVGAAALAAVVVAGLILARNPRSTPARMHAVYGLTCAWWLVSMALIATADSPARVQMWARLVHLGLGMLPAVVLHLTAATAGRATEHRREIRVAYGVSALVTLFCLSWPGLLAAPRRHPWGWYPAYTAWGAVPVVAMVAALGRATWIYQSGLRHLPPGSPHYRKLQVFYRGSFFSYLAVLDFLPAFGAPTYPFGYALLTIMYGATLFGSIRYQLIDVTPELAAESILETMPDGLLVTDPAGRVRVANSAAARLTGQPLDALTDRPLASMLPAGVSTQLFDPARAPDTGVELQVPGSDGDARYLAISGSRVHTRSGHHLADIWLLRDLTEQRKAEQETRRLESRIGQTQKLESLGVMACGVAHDFNNILMAILGSAETALAKAGPEAAMREELEAIATAAEHAAGLTRQLLTYAGRGAAVEAPVDLNAVVGEMAELLQSAVSKKARLDLALAAERPILLGDRSQIGQVVLNLVTNASEAIGDDPGVITLRTSVLTTADRAASRPGGWHALLEVADTGSGMSPEVQARMFDPFFTTKFTGRGLGLATVLGIVQKHGGTISVDSTPAIGTRVSVMLPARLDAGATAAISRPAARRSAGRGLALLADDEASVRSVVRRMLAQLGFDVCEACNGREAVALVHAHLTPFDLAVLDVTMPVMNGREAFEAIRRLDPDVPVLFVSGYTEIDGLESFVEPATAFLAKPFRFPAFSAKVNELTAGVIRSAAPSPAGRRLPGGPAGSRPAHRPEPG